MLEALEAATAICTRDGAIETTNEAWRQEVGLGRRVDNGAGLFLAFIDAANGEAALGAIGRGGKERQVRVAGVGDDRFLLQVIPEPPPPAPVPTQTPKSLDAFAGASPFGAALIEGADPLTGQILEVNAALPGIAGLGARVGGCLGDLMAPSGIAAVKAARAEGDPGPYDLALAADPDRVSQLYLSASGERWLAYLLDVTDQRQIQGRLMQRGKMEAIGQLAGGVAHDFNNLLTAISLRADELLTRHPLGDPAYDNLSEIRKTVVRAADVVRQLLTFSRKATIQRESLDLGEVLANFELLLRRLLREDVVLTADYGRNLPRVRADRAQLENAVMNLVVNARDAVAAKGGGVIALRTARVTADEAKGLGLEGDPAGDLALIEVADDGPGIPPEALGKLFEPFFSTKAVGEGTGLGLATVYGIVKQSDGWITVDSKPGHGAVFRIFLPVHAPALVTPEPTAPASPARDLSGVGRILFVEDETMVRNIAARLLRARGYEVLEAEHGEAALELAIEHAGKIDLMISDVVMPGMDGPTLLKQARPYLGDAAVMFISGYAEAEFSDLLEGETGVVFLPKPLDIKTLSQRVKDVIRGR